MDNQELTWDVIRFEQAVSTSLTPVPLSSNLKETTLGSIGSEGEITSLLFRSGEPPAQFKLADLKQLITQNENFVWVDLANYTEADLRNIAAELGLHPVAIKAALEGWHRPRLDNFSTRKHYLVTATIAHLNANTHQVLAAELDLFVGNNFLVSVHKAPLPFGKKITERAKQSPELVKLDAAFMLYIVLDEFLEYYEELSDHIEVETGEMEIRALKDASDSFLTDLVQLKQYIFALTRLVDQHRKVFATLVRPDNPLTNGAEVIPYFQDLESHFERLMDTLQPAKEAINGAFEIYVSHMAHKTNQVIKILTMLSTVLLPTTVIISLFGTNIVGLSQYGVLDFALMISLIVITSSILLILFRRKGWL